jgi:hypothetical protein
LGDNLASVVGFLNAAEARRRVSRVPLVGVYFGGGAATSDDLEALETLRQAAAPILPVVDDLANYPKLVPASLHAINGQQRLAGAKGLDPLVNYVLENFGLLRRARRMFISYRRTDSAEEALQLRHELDARGFDAFLDTHSVRKGADFQNQLWHRLADSDVALVLDTEGFKESQWTQEELARAEAMTIGVIQVIWPGVEPARYSELCERVYLEKASFEPSGQGFTEATTTSLADAAESLRARSTAARHDNIVREFCDVAKWVGAHADLQPDRYLVARTRDGRTINAIPAVGLPDAPSYHEGHVRFLERLATMEVWLVYDQRGLTPEWRRYLEFLDMFLPVKTVCITDVAARLA